MKKIVLIALCILPFLTFAQDTLVKWTFPNNPDDSVADGGIAANLNKTIRGIGCGTVGYANAGFTTYSARATGWDNGAGTKYWQVMLSTAGYDSLYYTSKQRSTNTGPKHFKIQYKIGIAGTWTDLPNAAVTDTSVWTQMITDTLPAACDDADSVFICWIMTDNVAVNGGTVAGGGASNIDDIIVWGHNISGIVAPVVNNAYINTLSDVKVIFSEAVNMTAENISNYTGLGTISSAVRNATLDTVSLTLATPLINGDAYTLTVADVQDIMGTPMAAPQSFNFLYNNSIANIVITEIMYNDPSSVSDSLEFIELYNNSSSAALVGGYQFKHSITTPTLLYSFPAGTTLAPNSYVVYAKNINAVNNFFFGITGTIQWISGQSLANTTDRLQILNTVSNIIDSLTYKTTSPWPTTPNGNGPSLTLCDPTLDNSVGSNWQASTEYVDSLNNKPVFATPGTGCVINNIENYSMNNYFVNCFPNPVSEVLTLTLDGQAKEIVVFDLIGNIVYKTSKLSSVTTITTEKLNNGIYFIKIIFNDNTIITRKISVI